jgi:hypothetical protein
MNPRLTILLPLIAALALPLGAQDTKPLKIEFPPPKVTSTPAPIKLPHLEPPQTPQPDIMVPAGVTNLAAGKEVTSSDPYPIIGDLTLITDGDKDSEDGYYVELGEGPQWVQIDLGAAAEIHAIAVWHYHAQARAYHDVIVQVSDDPEFKSGVTTLFNNDHDNSSKLGKGSDPAYVETNRGRVIPAKGKVARYVRLTSGGNTSDGLNHYIEVEVFGRPKA